MKDWRCWKWKGSSVFWKMAL